MCTSGSIFIHFEICTESYGKFECFPFHCCGISEIAIGSGSKYRLSAGTGTALVRICIQSLRVAESGYSNDSILRLTHPGRRTTTARCDCKTSNVTDLRL